MVCWLACMHYPYQIRLSFSVVAGAMMMMILVIILSGPFSVQGSFAHLNGEFSQSFVGTDTEIGGVHSEAKLANRSKKSGANDALNDEFKMFPDELRQQEFLDEENDARLWWDTINSLREWRQRKKAKARLKRSKHHRWANPNCGIQGHERKCRWFTWKTACSPDWPISPFSLSNAGENETKRWSVIRTLAALGMKALSTTWTCCPRRQKRSTLRCSCTQRRTRKCQTAYSTTTFPGPWPAATSIPTCLLRS